MSGRGTIAALVVVGLVAATQLVVAITSDEARSGATEVTPSAEVSPVTPQAEGSFYTWMVSGGTMTAEVFDDVVQVRLVWRANGFEGAMEPGTLQLGALQWPSVSVVGLEVMVEEGAPLPILEIEASTGVGSVAVERRWSAEVPDGDSLILLYAVRDERPREGDRRSVRIPVVLVESEPPASAPDVFFARITVPSGLSVLGGFPSGLSVGSGPDGTLVEASLPVLPRTIDLDLKEGDLGLLGRTAPLEAGALLLIFCAGAWGWRRLTAAG